MNEKNTIKELEIQARNTKSLMDRLNKAYIGLTTDEIIRMAMTKEVNKNVDRDFDASRSSRAAAKAGNEDISGNTP